MAVIFGIARRKYRSIPEAPPRTGLVPDCMVIIPARNEEAFIARAVKSLPADTVIVVDDHSKDATAEAARKADAGVLAAPDLPRGAVGKPNACMAGAAVLTSKWVLFANADTWFEPFFLQSAVGYAEENGLAMVSFRLRQEYETFFESLVGPYADALYFCGIGFSKDPAAVFSGQCVLVQREPYEFFGGHKALLSALTDEVKLARLGQRHRLKFSTVRAEKLGHARFREPVAALRRSSFRFLLLRSWIGVAVAFAALAVAAWGPALAWLIVDREWAAAAVFAILPPVLAFGWDRNITRALMAPLAIYTTLPFLFRGLAGALMGQHVKWKGRIV